MDQSIRFLISPSIQQATDALSSQPVTAAEFVKKLFEIHPDYAGGLSKDIILTTTIPKFAEEWIHDVQPLFDLSRIRNNLNSNFRANSKVAISSSNIYGDDSPKLNTRLMIIGLALLEPVLYEQMDEKNIIAALQRELQEELEEILTPKGKEYYQRAKTKNPAKTIVPPPLKSENTQFQADDAIEDEKNDSLARKSFAQFLAEHIQRIANSEKSENLKAYVIHLYGPWGSGKSSVLNLLKISLGITSNSSKNNRTTSSSQHINSTNSESTRSSSNNLSWVNVDFNAWQHQHIQPAWWPLMDRIIHETNRNLNLHDYFCELIKKFPYRLKFDIKPIIILLIGIAFISIDRIAGIVLSQLQTILASLVSISGLIALFPKSSKVIQIESAKAAQEYISTIQEPMTKIRLRFNSLIAKLKGKRLIVLIDDLDRCQSQYVVNLLEGIQTLFRDAPIVIVVAADRKWLNACYEEVYSKLKPHVYEPGKPLGTLFLEKAFRVSVPLPSISETAKEHYWDTLLQVYDKQTPQKTEVIELEKKLNDEVNAPNITEQSLNQIILASKSLPPPEQQNIRNKIAPKLASVKIAKDIEHSLKPYTVFLDPNPRTMKILINSYSINRTLSVLSGLDINPHQLRLWTILQNRWPILSDYLAENPKSISEILKPTVTKDMIKTKDLEINTHLNQLIIDPEVRHVLNGRLVPLKEFAKENQLNNAANKDTQEGALNEDTLEKCAKMRM